MIEKLYTAEVTVTGGGRNGHVKSSDGVIDFDVVMPKELGGQGGLKTNPEQLFGAGYSACFDGALRLVAKNKKISNFDSSVTAKVSIGKDETGLGISVELHVDIKNIDRTLAEEVMNEAHQVCPYSKATRNNVEVKLVLV
ncbi:MAG: organic hydroperoxide resistance protein [Bacteroidetes bacterium GWE2_29_8]|nr:MAG: organic hydroperoxide resistance protein [Bacteroidetes bacterium GWE2_29_8]